MKKTQTQPSDSPRPYWSSGTLGAIIDAGYQVGLHCDAPMPNCGFVKYLDLQKLADKLGRDHGSLYPDLAPRLWCTKCGARKIKLTLHPFAGPHPYSEKWD